MKSLFSIPVVASLCIASGVALAAEPAKATTDTPAVVKKLVVPGGKSDRTMTMNDAGNKPATRDWAKVDANKDNLVSPEEMEAYLAANPGPLKGK